MVAVANFKGGVGKTSTAAHLAMSAALDGYKVLVIDLDSQGSMTSIFGGQVADEWQTVFPAARAPLRRAPAIGEPARWTGASPLPPRRHAHEALKLTTRDLVQKTHWPNIDLIGAQLNLYWAEFQIPVWRMAARGWKLWDALTDRLAADGVLDAYDVVFLDTPPALGYLTINGLAAADILLVPLGASFLEFDSTGRFFDMLHSTFASIEEAENMAARALGREGCAFEWDAVRAVMTRYDGSQQAELGRADAGLSGPHAVAAPAGFHRADRPGGRAGLGHLRGRLPRFQPRDLCPRARDLRPDLCRLQTAPAGRLAARFGEPGQAVQDRFLRARSRGARARAALPRGNSRAAGSRAGRGARPGRAGGRGWPGRSTMRCPPTAGRSARCWKRR
jgi:cellulose biosynthesis protein BcsQ